MPFKRACANCGVTFETTKRNYFYCSYACYQQRAFKQRSCSYCAKSFEAPSWKTFCSGECRAKSTIASTIEDLIELASTGPKGVTEVGRQKTPFIPEVVGAFAYIRSYPENTQPIGSLLSKTAFSNVTRLLSESDELLDGYVKTLQVLLSFQDPRKDLKQEEIHDEFAVDATASLRSVALSGMATSIEEHELRGSAEFSTGRGLIHAIVMAIPSSGFRRCISCHLVAEGDRHFRKVKTQGGWGFDELCIYCNPREWYNDLYGR